MKMLSKIKFDKFFFSKKIVILFLVPILLMMLFYLFFFYPFINKSFLWRDINVEGLKIGNKSYDLENGILHKNGTERKLGFKFNPFELQENDKVLRLALSYQINKEDPLFNGPGLDKNRYEESVNRLVDAHKKLLDVTGFKENIIPVDFLEKTNEVLIAQKDFEEKKDYISAVNLINKYKETNEKYKKEATNLKDKLEKLSLPDKDLVQTGAVTSKDIILDDLKKIANNHNFLKKEINRREKCLKFSTYYCGRDLLEKNIDQINKVEKTDDSLVRILNKDELHYPGNPEEFVLSGPYKINTPCWRSNRENEKQYLFEMEKNINGEKRLIPKIANNNYYLKISPDSSLIIDRQYKKHGLEWRAVFMNASYACNNTEFQPILATINAYFLNYKDKNVFNRLKDNLYSSLPEEPKELVKKTNNLENKFFSEKFPSQDTLESLGSSYFNLYKFIIREEIKNNKNQWLEDLRVLKEDLLERYLFIDRKFADLDGTVNYLSFMIEGYSNMYKYNKGDRESYVYSMKNEYPISYLNFSPSVWRSDKSLQYIDKNKSKIREDIKDYYYMFDNYSKEYVDKINNIYREQVWYEVLE